MKMNEYVKFMCNPENEYNCKDCPENNGFSNWQNRLPCGQQNCWVTCHCTQNEEEEETR